MVHFNLNSGVIIYFFQKMKLDFLFYYLSALPTTKSQISANKINQDLLNFIKGKDSLVDAVINQQSKFKLQIIYGKLYTPKGFC